MSRRTITADATGRRSVPPERATVELKVTGDGDSPTAARRTVADRAATLRASLTDEVPSADRVATVELRVSDSSKAFDPATDAPYFAVERLHVDCAPETASEVAVVATESGATVPDVQFRLDETVHRRLQDEALADAMARARAKADRLAAAEELSVGRVREVTTETSDDAMSDIVEEALANGPETDLSPEPIAVSETVEVVYELADD
ncbi:SIMPL domain-containing protein [Halorussus salinus]|uniref:SIMPL domain-containing protein n=1 Tax=Halorussus salinus TaxID=1364935 RepID=UPI001092E20C|nr:SIMPL domain-containing protein [Halorussus salinus]